MLSGEQIRETIISEVARGRDCFRIPRQRLSVKKCVNSIFKEFSLDVLFPHIRHADTCVHALQARW
jgi:hypothetical protein